LDSTLLKDKTLNSASQPGCIWTKVFLAWKEFLASALGYYMLYTTFFRRQWKIPVVFLFPKMELSHATGRFRWCTVPLNGNFQLKYCTVIK
jgi:hypothetical protein